MISAHTVESPHSMHPPVTTRHSRAVVGKRADLHAELGLPGATLPCDLHMVLLSHAPSEQDVIDAAHTIKRSFRAPHNVHTWPLQPSSTMLHL